MKRVDGVKAVEKVQLGVRVTPEVKASFKAMAAAGSESGESLFTRLVNDEVNRRLGVSE